MNFYRARTHEDWNGLKMSQEINEPTCLGYLIHNQSCYLNVEYTDDI